MVVGACVVVGASVVVGAKVVVVVDAVVVVVVVEVVVVVVGGGATVPTRYEDEGAPKFKAIRPFVDPQAAFHAARSIVVTRCTLSG